MSATLIMSASDTNDPDIQQQRAAEERREQGGCSAGQGAAAGGRKPAGQSISWYTIRWCKNHMHGCMQSDQGKKTDGCQWRSVLYSSLFRW